MRLQGGPWQMEVLPLRGGRIGSLKLEGVELLDQGVGVDVPSASGFVEAGAWGWDEMVPTVDASVWETIDLPDHGEAWRLPWDVEEAGPSSCSMRCDGKVMLYRLERTISLGPAVQVRYRLSNRGPSVLPAYWCSHALFRYEKDMRVDVGVTLMSFAEGKSAKFFLPRGAIDRARLSWNSGLAVEVAWDREVAPYCGVWICNGDLGGYRQVAVEPATGGGDHPHADEPPPLLAQGESVEWWMEVRSVGVQGKAD